jgi:hypothetical protein
MNESTIQLISTASGAARVARHGPGPRPMGIASRFLFKYLGWNLELFKPITADRGPSYLADLKFELAVRRALLSGACHN